jgi:putative ABC transport system permease protein
MTRLRILIARLTSLFRFDRRLEEEIDAHLDLAAAAYLARGLSPDDARLAARRDFGGVARAVESCRDVSGYARLNAIAQDLHHAIRVFRKQPAFSAAIVVTLAAGIGANTVILSAVRAVLVHPLPYGDAGRLVFVSRAYPGFPQGGGNFSYPAYRDIVEQNTVFDELAAYQDFGALALTDGSEPVRARVCYVTPSYLRLLDVRAAAGRLFRDADDRFGSAEAVVVLSYHLWQSRYASSPEIVGRTVHFNQHPLTVVGVAAEGFRDALAEREDAEPVDAWVPLGLAHELTGMSGASDRGGAITWGVGRLKRGVSVEQANADLAAIAARLARVHPSTDAGFGLVARPLRDQLVGELYTPVTILAGGALLILLTGCANVASLLMARTIARRREFAVRAALGASAGRLLQQAVVEQALLMTVAVAFGGVAAALGVAAMTGWTARHLSTVLRFPIDGWMMATAIGVALASGLLFGAAPALAARRVDLRDALALAGRAAIAGRRRAAAALVIVEVALAMALLVSAGLLVKSLHRLTSTDLGFDSAQLLTLRIDLRSARYETAAARARFGALLTESVGHLPGVRSATLWGPAMLGRATWVMEAAPEGRDKTDRRNVLTFERHSVNPGGLGNLGIGLLAGRDFDEHDTAERPLISVISHTLAETWWPGQNAVGKRFYRPTDPAPITVVGVAADARHRERFALADAAIGIPPGALGPQRDAYFAYAQRPNQALVVAARVAGGASGVAVASSVRGAVLALDPALPIYDVAFLDDRLADQERGSRVLALLSGTYAAVAVGLAAFGLIAVLAHDVRRRTAEIGIRVALGGRPRDVLWMILRDGLALTSAGVAAGSIAAVVLTKVMASILFGVRPDDLSVYGAIALLLVGVATSACLIPARRATLVDTLVALRCE